MKDQKRDKTKARGMIINLNFGGSDGKKLFVTSGKRVYEINVTVKGHFLWPHISSSSHDEL